MPQATTTVANKPAWIDLSSPDVKASADFYSRLFGWRVEVNPDPQYGGYALAKIGNEDAAGIAPRQMADAPTAWSLYIATEDAEDLARRVKAAGGNVIMAPFDVGDQGRMAVFQDPSGAYISAWQGLRMGGFSTNAANSFGWAELNARNVQRALPFYTQVFGWSTRTSEIGDGQPPYTEFQIDGESIAGAWEMSPMVPANVPSYWQIYFTVDDVDAASQKAIDAGAMELLEPQDFPGGRFAILSDPQGASFGLLKVAPL
jgi:uncharacterized protein